MATFPHDLTKVLEEMADSERALAAVVLSAKANIAWFWQYDATARVACLDVLAGQYKL